MCPWCPPPTQRAWGCLPVTSRAAPSPRALSKLPAAMHVAGPHRLHFQGSKVLSAHSWAGRGGGGIRGLSHSAAKHGQPWAFAGLWVGPTPPYLEPRPPPSFRALPGRHGSPCQEAPVPASPPRPRPRQPLSPSTRSCQVREEEPTALLGHGGRAESPSPPREPQSLVWALSAPLAPTPCGKPQRDRAGYMHMCTHVYTQHAYAHMAHACDMCLTRLHLRAHHAMLTHVCAPHVHGPHTRTASHPARVPRLPP